MKTTHTAHDAPAGAPNIIELQKEACGDLCLSFVKFCLTCGIEVLEGMMDEDVGELAGERHERAPDKPGHRWGSTFTRLVIRRGKVPLVRPRVRDKTAGKEIPLASREHFSNWDHLREWAAT